MHRLRRTPFDGDDVKTVLLAAAASITDSGTISWWWYAGNGNPAALKTYVYPSAMDVSEVYYVDVESEPEVLDPHIYIDNSC